MTVSASIRDRIDGALISKGEVTARKMFGTVAFLVRGRMFAFWTAEGLVVKLPDVERKDLLERRAASAFQGPQGGNFGEWVRVDVESDEDGDACLQAAGRSYEYVRGHAAKQQGRKKSRR